MRGGHFEACEDTVPALTQKLAVMNAIFYDNRKEMVWISAV